jgi:hypothetical protein
VRRCYAERGGGLCQVVVVGVTEYLRDLHLSNRLQSLSYGRFKRALFRMAEHLRKVRGLNLLLRVGTFWRCGEGLFFEVPLLASDALFTTLHRLLENVTGVIT